MVVTFGPMDFSQTVSVPLIDDDSAENNENFIGQLTLDSSGVELGADLATATIIDNDSKNL